MYLEKIDKKIDLNSFGGWAISKEMFDWISNNFQENSVILELGSGNGTKELVKKYKVYSVEHDLNWIGYVPESNYIFAPLVDGWYDKDILKNNLPSHYDLLLVDGPIKKNRINFINNFELFNNKTIMIFDDTNRTEDKNMVLDLSKKLNKELIEFEGTEKNFTVLI